MRGGNPNQIPVPINSIKIPEHMWTPSTDILAEPMEDEPEVKAPIASIDVDDDPDVYHAQIDTGAFVTCTDQKHLLHGYSTYDEDCPSPVWLLPATDGSDVVPEGHGYLHVPAGNSQGFLAVHCYYHPSLCTMVIDEHDLAWAAGHKDSDIASENLVKFHNAGTFTYHAKHKLQSSYDVVIHGILCHREVLYQCTYPLL
jgi:hypothetical protein